VADSQPVQHVICTNYRRGLTTDSLTLNNKTVNKQSSDHVHS